MKTETEQNIMESFLSVHTLRLGAVYARSGEFCGNAVSPVISLTDQVVSARL